MDSKLDFVWQQNGVFMRAGSRVARKKRVPFVLQVEAPVVWEAARWGVRRPMWGRLIERFGELPDMRRADVVACVSEEVANEVRSMGVPQKKILITPCSVDPNRFAPDVSGTSIRDSLGVGDRFVVGWVGGFRSFHGLGPLIEAAEHLASRQSDLCLMLVGDGILRPSIEDDVRRRGLTNVVFTGAVPHVRVPEYINAFDVAVVSSPEGSAFHYAPLKLREYMACGRPVIAPNVGQIPKMAVDGEEAVLITPGSTRELARSIELLRKNPELSRTIGLNARCRVERDGTWDHQVSLLLEALDARSRPIADSK